MYVTVMLCSIWWNWKCWPNPVSCIFYRFERTFEYSCNRKAL